MEWPAHTEGDRSHGRYRLRPIPSSGLQGIFTLHGMEDAEGIKNYLAEGKARDVVIVGGGLISVEMTEALVLCGCRVTIIEKLPQSLDGRSVFYL